MTNIPTEDFRTIKTNGVVVDIERRWIVGTGEIVTIDGNVWGKVPIGDDWIRLPNPDTTSPGGGQYVVYYSPRYERVVSEWRVVESRNA